MEKLRYILNIDITETIVHNCKSPMDLVDKISTCEQVLTSKIEFDDDRILTTRRMKEFRANFNTFKNFIINAPSDYYRLLHPKSILTEKREKLIIQ